MTIEQIRYVVLVNKYKSFSRAADALFISQSSLSKNIIKLEKELNILIFERSTRTVSLTSVGEMFIEFATSTLKKYEKFEEDLNLYNKNITDKIMIGTIYSNESLGINSTISKFLDTYPNVSIEIVESSTVPLTYAVEESKIDIAFVSSMYRDTDNPLDYNFKSDKRFISHTISKDYYYLAVNNNNPLAHKKYLNYTDLLKEKFITLDSRFEVYHNAFNRVFKEEHFTPNVSMKCSSVRSVVNLVSAGAGIAFLSTRVVNDFNSDIVMVPIKRPLIRDTQIIMANKKNRSINIHNFFNTFINTFLS